MSMISFHSRATHSSSSMILLVLRQEGSRNFMMYCLLYTKWQKQIKYRTKSMQYGVFYHSLYTACQCTTLATNNVFRFCFAPDISRPLLELEQMFFNEQHCGNGKIT
jgi:hypothetical protein